MVNLVPVPICSCEGAEEHDSFPTFAVVWDDGYEEELLGACGENDMGIRTLGDSYECVASGGMFHPDGFPASYLGSFLWKVRDNLHILCEGDVDEEMRSWYLRGDLYEVLSHYFASTEMNYVPFRELLIAKHFGLLAEVEPNEGGYPVSLFNTDDEFAGLLFDLEVHLPDRVFTPWLSTWADAVPWLIRVRDGDEPEASTWGERVAAFDD
jgi:hypothetical protein